MHHDRRVASFGIAETNVEAATESAACPDEALCPGGKRESNLELHRRLHVPGHTTVERGPPISDCGGRSNVRLRSHRLTHVSFGKFAQYLTGATTASSARNAAGRCAAEDGCVEQSKLVIPAPSIDATTRDGSREVLTSSSPSSLSRQNRAKHEVRVRRIYLSVGCHGDSEPVACLSRMLGSDQQPRLIRNKTPAIQTA
jgi:hypothetical protein